MSTAADSVRYLRPSWLAGVEGLHATFVDHRYALHVHEEWTFALIERGSARFRLGRAEHVARPGQVVVIPPGVAHTGAALDASGYRYRALYVDPDRATLPAAAFDAYRQTDGLIADSAPLGATVRVLHTALDRSSDERARALEALVVLATLLGLPASRAPRATRRVVAQACSLLRSNEGRAMSLDDLAGSVRVSRFALAHAFRDELGISPHRYAMALQVDRAKRLLRRGHPAASVAADTGFCDQAHLTRVFREIVGITPARYQRSR